MRKLSMILAVAVVIAISGSASARLCAFKPVCVGCAVTPVVHTYACAAGVTACSPGRTNPPKTGIGEGIGDQKSAVKKQKQVNIGQPIK